VVHAHLDGLHCGDYVGLSSVLCCSSVCRLVWFSELIVKKKIFAKDEKGPYILIEGYASSSSIFRV
jgi:hypothetical protein